MNGYRITEARQDDLAAIVDIYNSTIDSRLATADLSPATVESRQSWLDAHGGNRPLYVLKNQEGELLAWGGFSDYHPRETYRITAEISIYVAPDKRGRGLGKRLLQDMLRRNRFHRAATQPCADLILPAPVPYSPLYTFLIPVQCRRNTAQAYFAVCVFGKFGIQFLVFKPVLRYISVF